MPMLTIEHQQDIAGVMLIYILGGIIGENMFLHVICKSIHDPRVFQSLIPGLKISRIFHEASSLSSQHPEACYGELA